MVSGVWGLGSSPCGCCDSCLLSEASGLWSMAWVLGFRVEAHYLANAVVIKVAHEEGWSVLGEGRAHIVGKPEPGRFRV